MIKLQNDENKSVGWWTCRLAGNIGMQVSETLEESLIKFLDSQLLSFGWFAGNDVQTPIILLTIDQTIRKLLPVMCTSCRLASYI